MLDPRYYVRVVPLGILGWMAHGIGSYFLPRDLALAALYEGHLDYNISSGCYGDIDGVMVEQAVHEGGYGRD